MKIQILRYISKKTFLIGEEIRKRNKIKSVEEFWSCVFSQAIYDKLKKEVKNG